MCSIAAAGLALSAASTAATIYQNQQVARANNDQQEAAAQRASTARQAELARQDGLRQERAAVADQNLAATGAEGTAERLADATADRTSATGEVPLVVGEGDIAPVQTTGNSVVGNAITAEVAKHLGQARQRLAARARLSAYDDVAADEARMRTLSGSAFEALKSMSAGSTGVYGSESSIPAGQVTPGAGSELAQAGILAGNAVAANPATVGSWLNGTTRPADQLAGALTDRVANLWGPARS
jgi:hypothetical protein